MDSVLDSLSVLHLLRPWWLLLVLPVLLLWWRVRRTRGKAADQPSGIARHLAEALTVGEAGARRVQPIDGAALAMVLLTLAAAGPTWSRVPNPFLAQTAPLVVVLEVSDSMQNPDVPPTRLDRARFKIIDLIERRAGASTALVAYAGTAHRVAPLTDDPNILKALLDGLGPEVMPADGDNASAAMQLAEAELARVETPGAILFVLDGLNSVDLPAFTNRSEADPPVMVLFAAPETATKGALDNITGAEIIQMTADDADLDRIERAAQAAYRAALLGDDRLDWEDRGWMLAWPAAVILLFWFRKGWTARWALVLGLALGLSGPKRAEADVIDWFFTPDQQGMMAYRDKDFAKAGELFLDPMWRAYAKFRAGQYADAAEIFARIETAEAAMGEGMSRIRNREYRPGVAAFERALELRPDYPEAQHNLEVARYIVDYVETAREQSDTGEESGIGADDVVFDNEAQRGAETQQEYQEEVPEFQTAEQWMRSVDTDMSDFLRTRFRLEAAEDGQ
ncbi:VWA domain-containing protein [Ruegeria sediminis]|uniref:VWA domain-containing protein n=1 Tax=Ruegeria sediminis TaxID=2583820 RepID=A0ABY2X256_9RHOB|nr:VWA domain-containing protein [Ruegeria sediminis]TMV09047.1 VWA domain-containing protein [Ruegeria sediminis]